LHRRHHHQDHAEDDNDDPAMDDDDLMVLAPCAVYYESANDYVGGATPARPGAGGWFLGKRYRFATDVKAKTNRDNVKQEPSAGTPAAAMHRASDSAITTPNGPTITANDPGLWQSVRHRSGGSATPGSAGSSRKKPMPVTVYFDDGMLERVIPGPLSLVDLREQMVDGARCLVFDEDSAPDVYCQLEPTKLEVGDLVYGRHQNGANWYRGRIAKVGGPAPSFSSSSSASPKQHKLQLCNVAYDDGYLETDIPFGAPPHHGNVWKVVCSSLPCHGWLDGIRVNLPSKRCREAASGIMRVSMPAAAAPAQQRVSIEYRDKNGKQFFEERSPGSLAAKILADAVEHQPEERTMRWPMAAAAAAPTARARPSKKRTAGAPVASTARATRLKRDPSGAAINDESRETSVNDTSFVLKALEVKGGAIAGTGGSKLGGRPTKPPPPPLRGAISAASAKTTATLPTSRLGLTSKEGATAALVLSISAPSRLRRCRRAASDKKPVYNDESSEDEESSPLSSSSSAMKMQRAHGASKMRTKRKIRTNVDDEDNAVDIEEDGSEKDDEIVDVRGKGGSVPGSPQEGRLAQPDAKANPTASSALLVQQPRKRNGYRSTRSPKKYGDCVDLTALSDHNMMILEDSLSGKGKAIDPYKPSAKRGDTHRPKTRFFKKEHEGFDGDASWCIDDDNDDDEEAVPKSCTPYVPHIAGTVTWSSTSLVSKVAVHEMQAMHAHKFVNALTAESTKWACDLISLVNEVHRMVVPAGNLKKLVHLLMNGPMHNETPFPDILMMDYCVSYISSYMASGPDQKQYLASEIFNSHWEEFLGRMTAAYYVAPGDETRLNRDAFLRRSQSLHAKMCCARVVSTLLRSGVDECITDPSLRESHPVFRKLTSHRNGAKGSLEMAVTATANLWMKNGFLVVGDKDFAAPSRGVPFPLSPPSEHLIGTTKRYAECLFAELGEVCTYLAWLYATEERLNIKLVARVVANSFRQELINHSTFDPSSLVTENMNRECYISCIQLEFAMSLGMDLVPHLRCSVAQGLGISKLWNSVHGF
jgi:hypothetical protein